MTSPYNTKSGSINNPEIIDFKKEVLAEFNNHSYDSLKIWKMFQSKKSNLPNNQRIQNLSWRVSSLSASKKQLRLLKNQSRSRIQQKNLSLLKSSNHPTNDEFDYIEHIKKMTKEEFGDHYNNQSLNQIPLPYNYKSNPINIGSNTAQTAHGVAQNTSASTMNARKNSNDIDYSPEGANSYTSNTNSIFSTNKFDHSLSVSSQVSAAAAPLYQTALHNPLPSHIQHHPSPANTLMQPPAGSDFNIDHFLDLDTTPLTLRSKNDSNFNEFDLLDLTKFDPTHDDDDVDMTGTHRHMAKTSQEQENFSLSNYISSLETSVKDSEPASSMITPIFDNQITTVSDTFTIPNNTNYNVNPKNEGRLGVSSGLGAGLGAGHKEQMSCNSCGTTTTPLWRKSTNEKNETLILCNACGLFLKLHGNLSKRNVRGNGVNKGAPSLRAASELFQKPSVARNDDHMGEIFMSAPALGSSTQSNLKVEDYDWLKYGL